MFKNYYISSKWKKTVCIPLSIKGKKRGIYLSLDTHAHFEYLKTQFQRSIIYPGTVKGLYQELVKRGYTGSQNTLARHVRILKTHGLIYKKDNHLFLISEKKCYELAGCHHKVHPSKYLLDVIRNDMASLFDVPELVAYLKDKSDVKGRKYTLIRIKNNIRHLRFKGFLKYDHEKELYQMQNYDKAYRLINQHKHTIRLYKSDSLETIKEKITLGLYKLISEQKKYIGKKDSHSNRLTRSTARQKCQSEVEAEKPQCISQRELATFGNFSINNVRKYLNKAESQSWVKIQRYAREKLCKAPFDWFAKHKAELIKLNKTAVYFYNGNIYSVRAPDLKFNKLIFK